jgi:hypothetical protein
METRRKGSTPNLSFRVYTSPSSSYMCYKKCYSVIELPRSFLLLAKPMYAQGEMEIFPDKEEAVHHMNFSKTK